ncbi:hypothetical protein GPECTOR_37g249 [Gonium pectorale]|uniref:F-box domain-containing protein n=1 Tax=Gonium pectorale TaxID=33097 RepID=A0A150GBU7_GONPE|nr:hypothetical protein GPECTOR_37g249 [Gonium pectorale]|eukprot:KXZ47243.1 hypothetical protein GPECTOR_37g249 [Gonium pectorale]
MYVANAPRIWPELPAEIAERIVSHLDGNEVAASFRLVNKAAAAQFSGPQHTVTRLSRPVHPHAFAAHWLAPGATRGLTLRQRRQLACLTAASGVLANLEVALRAGGCEPTREVARAAAAAGHLAPVQWLLLQQRDRLADSDVRLTASGALEAAAGAGHRHVCEWLLGLGGLSWRPGWAVEAARGGHVGLMEWLLQLQPPAPGGPADQAPAQTRPSSSVRLELVLAAAHGCDLATLRRLWRTLGEGDGAGEPDGVGEADMRWALAAAAGSPTPDWAAKVEWLEACGCPRSAKAARQAAACAPGSPDAAARLPWLRSRGYPLDRRAAEGAVHSGNAAALQYLLAGAAPEGSRHSASAATAAAAVGDLAALQTVCAAGWRVDARRAGLLAAAGGHVAVLAWLVEALGEEAVGLDSDLLNGAAGAGSVELLAWLRERGCEWDGRTFAHAARSGCEAALEWLAERGCPMPDDCGPYGDAVLAGDLATASCLRRLGCPWGDGDGAAAALARAVWSAPLPLVRWMLEAGCCPAGEGAGDVGGAADDGRVLAAVGQLKDAERAAALRALLEEHRRRRRGHPQG